MEFENFPRRRYTEGYTPIQYLKHVTEHLAGPDIYIKRDDMLGLTLGGNKTRKLEFLMGQALKEGADTIITCGALQSNHCRLTLAAAVREGLHCQLVLEEYTEGTYDDYENGNYLLFELLGVENVRVVPRGSDLNQETAKLKEELEQAGRKPYVIPIGGSNGIGSLGYMTCANEIVEQSNLANIQFDGIICVSGSGGTHAGLLAGLHKYNANIPVYGMNISREKSLQESLVHSLVEQVNELVVSESPFLKEKVMCFDTYVGKGYAMPTEEMVKAVKLVGCKEAIMLDPVYTGKAMAGLIDLIQKGYFKKGQKLLFLHTGGSPALFTFKPTLTK